MKARPTTKDVFQIIIIINIIIVNVVIIII